jgi:hypothetical protein
MSSRTEAKLVQGGAGLLILESTGLIPKSGDQRGHAPDWLPRIRVREGSRVRHRFWQPGGGYDRNIAGGSTLRHVMDYIHANPVRRGLVERPEDWEWSSARWYAGIHPSLIEMDRTLPADLDDMA